MESLVWTTRDRAELAAMLRPGELSLLCGDRSLCLGVLGAVAAAVDELTASVTQVVLDAPAASSERDVIDRIGERRFLYDLECLCWRPWLALDPVKLLRGLSRRRGVVAVWPGTCASGVLEFSAPGRPDHVRTDASGLALLHVRPSRFPDEVPFTIERLP